MKKNNYFKNHKRGWVALLLIFCGLFVNTTFAQDTFKWNGSASTDWATAANWDKTGTSGTDTYPGETSLLDLVVIDKNDTPFAPIIASGTFKIFKLTVSNAFGTEVGATLTINFGATLEATNNTNVELVRIEGGNIINNGTLKIKSTDTTATTGMAFATPFVPPSGSTEYGYSGNGILTIDLSASTTSTSYALNFFANNANTTYKVLCNKATTTISLTTSITAEAGAIRNTGVSPVIIGGTGFTVNGNGGLLRLAAQTTTTIDTGTTLTMNSDATNNSPVIGAFTSGVAPAPITFVNKGTINGYGTSKKGAIQLSMQNTNNSNFAPTGNVINFQNQGTMDINMTITAASLAPLTVFQDGTGQGNINITNGGTWTLRNNQANGANLGAAIFIAGGGNTPNIKITNNGILHLRGNNQVQGGNGGTVAIPRSSLINNGTITTNHLIQNWVVSNNSTGSIEFVSPVGGGSFAIAFNSGAFGVNNGTIKTATGAPTNLTTNVLRNIASYGATSVLEPGGAGYGVTDLGVVNPTGPAGKVKLQIAGTVPGVDYDQLTVISSGIGYAGSPTIAISGGRGSGAAGYVTIVGGAITAVTIVSGGSGYNVAPTLTFNVGSGATATATVVGGVVTGVSVSAGGSAYTTATNVTFTSGTGTNATASVAVNGSGRLVPTLLTGGTNYTTQPIVAVSGGTNTRGATFTANVSGGVVTGFNLNVPLSNLHLELPFLYTPAGSTTIPIVTTTGVETLSGNFASVTGLKGGWALDYSSSTVVNLVYTPGLTTATSWSATAVSTDWTNAANWTSGVPTVSSDVTILAGTNQPVIATNVDINSLNIAISASLTVNSGFNLAVTDVVTNGGALTLQNNANLIQVNSVTNSGNITVNRNSNALSRLDYTIWSSPLAGQDLLLFSPATLTTRFYNYNEVTNAYNVVPSPSGTPFSAGSGYLIRMPDTAVVFPATQTFAAAFTGTPNNGTINKAITYSGAAFGYNMIGNPYPSTIDAQAFIIANAVNIESSLYFWRKINAATGSAYAVYNPLGATTATPSSAVPNGTIQVGQGFFVRARSGATALSFTNAMRFGSTSTQFFKTKAAQKDRLWVNLTNPAGVYSQALVGYTADAIIGIDVYDAKYINDSPVALTSNINGEEYTIQGRPAFDATDAVALNFKTDVAGDFTIALDRFDGVFATGQDVYLLDSKTGVETDLKAGSYNFTATAGVDNARFSLKYQKTLKVDAPTFTDNSVSIYKNNGSLYVNSGSVAINTIEVYDVQGRLLVSQRNVKATTATISNLRAINQVLIVKIVGENNSVVSKKVVN